MNAPPRPPALPRRLLERALPEDVREDVSGDLAEMFHRRCAQDGTGAARRWYWRQTLAFSTRFLAERLRERRKQIDMSTGFSGMDVKLAVRMLVRSPGLTIVGTIGMAAGIAIAAGSFGVLYTLTDATLPLDEGDRIVALQTENTRTRRTERRILHDFLTWREELTQLQDVGAHRTVVRNLIVEGTLPEPVQVAEMSAAGFRVARVAPLMGRALVEADERPASPLVVVIGADVWRNRFAADPSVVGRTVRLGNAVHTVVGVMPGDFRFPVSHSIWTPLRIDAAVYRRLEGPALQVFGRLAPGATFESAGAELTAVAQRTAAAHPDTHAALRSSVLPYTFPSFDIDDPEALWTVHLFQFLITLLLVVISVNVAILVYARTATRHAEIAVRSALGASRRRIVGQLFVEALALSSLAALVGLALTSVGLRHVTAAMHSVLAGAPFWWRFEVSPGMVLYVAGLAVLAAAIVGVLPALKATGRRVQSGLQRISAGGGSGMQFGRTWTVLIVLQVAIAVALLPAAVFSAWESMRYASADPGYASEEFLSARLVLDGPGASAGSSADDLREVRDRFAARQAELRQRLESEPEVSHVTFAASAPGKEPAVWIEVEHLERPAPDGPDSAWVATGTRAGYQAGVNQVEPTLFAALGVPVLAGRGLSPGDASPAAPAVVVNASFVRTVLNDGPALGRRLRYVGVSNDADPGAVELQRWYEIVGVVSDFPAMPMESGRSAVRLYHAAAPGGLHGGLVLVRLRGDDPARFTGRLRAIAAAVDPNLQVRSIEPLGRALRDEQRMMRVIATVLAGLTASILLLSAAGVYALMSFTVAQRRKEIGIRAALGADPRRIFTSIFSRALRQLAAGATIGAAIAWALELATDGGLMGGHAAVVLPVVVSVIVTIGLLAAVGPARRGLRVHPTEALREP